MEHTKKKVLIEATKLLWQDNDGIHRYGMELLRGLLREVSSQESAWDIDVYIGMWFTFHLADIQGFLSSGSGAPFVSAATVFKLKLLLWNIRIKRGIRTTLRKIFAGEIVDAIEAAQRRFDEFFWKFFTPLDFSAYDIVHILLPQGYAQVSRSPMQSLVTTTHDLTHVSHPQFHTANNIRLAQKGFDFCVNRQAAFIAVSESTRQDLLSAYQDGLSPEDVYTIHEASDPAIFYPVSDPARLKAVRTTYSIPEKPYLLSLSTLEPRKNVINTITAFTLLIRQHPELDLCLVIAGKKGWKYQEILNTPVLQAGRIIFTGFVAEEDLAPLYSGALAFSYVSYYEGFGLPLLEAMSCGTPVIYGNTSSMPEVVGDGGLPADPADVEEIKQQFARIVLDENLRTRLAEHALRQAQKFSWENTVHETLAVYEQIVRKASFQLSS